MNERTDPELLREYAERRSEAAFAELVRRHIDLVHSAALRMVRDPHLAQDVTQAAFVALAKDARLLLGRPVLAGWLHRTAQNLAANVVRAEVRRRAREQEAATMNELLATPAEPGWEQIAPLLDEALGELTDPDRDALLLRYFERQSAREMAQRLGVSDEAAQKRVSRAVERLREFFAQRGVKLGTGGLVAVISANAVQAAPVGLAATVSTAAVLAGTTFVTTATATTAAKTIAMTTLQKTLVVATVTVLASAGIYQATEASRLRREVAAVRSEQAPLAEEVTLLQREREAAARQLAALRADNALLKQDTDDLLRLRGEVTRLRALDGEVAKLRTESLRQQHQVTEARAAQVSSEQTMQRFGQQRAVIISTLKRLAVQLQLLAGESNLTAALTTDGRLSPALLGDTAWDLSNVELLAKDPATVGKLIYGAPQNIVVRTVEAIPTPDGRWMRFYGLADGSVHDHTSETPEHKFIGTWPSQDIEQVPDRRP